MNKQQLIERMAIASNLTQREAKAALEAFIVTVEQALVADEKVSLVGFGSFSVRHRGARKGRNPQTGETIDIVASCTAGFKTGKSLQGTLNKSVI